MNSLDAVFGLVGGIAVFGLTVAALASLSKEAARAARRRAAQSQPREGTPVSGKPTTTTTPEGHLPLAL
jgi:hypothetical protein